jgi:hypothetical protein
MYFPKMQDGPLQILPGLVFPHFFNYRFNLGAWNSPDLAQLPIVFPMSDLEMGHSMPNLGSPAP